MHDASPDFLRLSYFLLLVVAFSRHSHHIHTTLHSTIIAEMVKHDRAH